MEPQEFTGRVISVSQPEKDGTSRVLITDVEGRDGTVIYGRVPSVGQFTRIGSSITIRARVVHEMDEDQFLHIVGTAECLRLNSAR